MHGPWHMREHPDERDDGGAQEREAEERRLDAFAEGEPPTFDELFEDGQ